MAAGFVALSDDDVDAQLHVTHCLLDPADQRRHLHALGVGLVYRRLWRRAEGARQQCDRVRQGNLDLRRAGGGGPAQHASAHARAGLQLHAAGAHIDPVVGQDFVDVIPVVLGDVGPELRTNVAHVVYPGVAVNGLDGHHHIDPVGLAVDVFIDPGELHLELLGRERKRAEDAHAAGIGHCGHHVAAMRESENRVFDPEHFGQRVFHAWFSGTGSAVSMTSRARL